MTGSCMRPYDRFEEEKGKERRWRDGMESKGKVRNMWFKSTEGKGGEKLEEGREGKREEGKGRQLREEERKYTIPYVPFVITEGEPYKYLSATVHLTPTPHRSVTDLALIMTGLWLTVSSSVWPLPHLPQHTNIRISAMKPYSLLNKIRRDKLLAFETWEISSAFPLISTRFLYLHSVWAWRDSPNTSKNTAV